jgi:hypothetical protein
MPYYRLYCVDNNGRFYRCDDFNADTDELAIAVALGLRGGDAAELWQQGRMVRSVAAEQIEQHG